MNSESIQEKVEKKLLDSYESLYRLAFSYVRNEEDALDIIQESAYKAIKNAKSIREEDYIKTWLWRIVINTSLDCIKKNHKECSLDSIVEKGKEDVYTDFDTRRALDVLNHKERTIITLRFFQEWKLEEIAKVLNININTVKTLLYRSLKKLENEISNEEKGNKTTASGGNNNDK